MAVAVFGASGRTGQAVVREAVGRGLSVRALCRPNAACEGGASVEIFLGDLRNADDLDRAISGCQAVCCVFGPRPPHVDVFCAEATRGIIEAMRRGGVRRLVCQTGAMIGPDVPNWTFGVRMLVRLFRRQRPAIADDRADQDEIVEESDLDWTLVKPPRLTDGPATGRVRTGADLRISLLSKISRRDLARFLVGECVNPQFVGQMVYVMT